MAKAERKRQVNVQRKPSARSGDTSTPADKLGRKPATGKGGDVVAALEHARWRHFGWGMFGLVVGLLFVIVLGIVGKLIGVVLLVVAALNGRNFAKTLLHEPGTIRVGAESLVVPAGLCRGVEQTYSYEQVHHAFFLRRAVSWTRAGPVLVIEAGDHAYSFPRDWFASESDQKRVVQAINKRLGRD